MPRATRGKCGAWDDGYYQGKEICGEWGQWGREVIGTLYVMTNKDTGKSYIGQAIDFDRRLKDHKRRDSDSYISRTIRVHGIDKFKITQISLPQELLNYWESMFISGLNTMRPNGYNLTAGGDGARGYKRSLEWCKARSEARKGRPLSQEVRERISQALKGRKMSPETKAKMSISRMGHPISEETREKISMAQRGRKLSIEQCEKLSAAKVGKRLPPFSEEHRAKIGMANSKSVRLAWQDPEKRLRMLAGRTWRNREN
jgi:group I intron endonuclease